MQSLKVGVSKPLRHAWKMELKMHGLRLQIRDAREMLNERRSLSNKDVTKDVAKDAVKPAKPEPVKAVSACCFQAPKVQRVCLNL